MELNSRIYVAGHQGLVGSALVRRLIAGGYQNIITRSHGELDLVDQRGVQLLFEQERPDYVLLAAAKVGGIHANSTYPGDFIFQNLAIQTNIIEASRRYDVKRLLFLGSSCIYPRQCPQPIREEYLLSGPLEPTNRAYALAKIAGVEMCDAYNKQYGTHYLAAMPTNCYGPGDHYDLMNSHVLPALIRKTHEAKISGAREVVIWGTGQPCREFIYSDDLADACVFLMNLGSEFNALLGGIGKVGALDHPLINIGVGEDMAIQALAELAKQVVGFTGALAFDRSKPDGTPRKLLDSSRIRGLGWLPRTSLLQGMTLAYDDFLSRSNART